MIEELAQLFSLSPPGWGGNLLEGLVKTLQIAVGAYAMGILLGMLGAVGKVWGPLPVRVLLELYTGLVRAIPELILILLLYFAGNDLLNVVLQFFGYRPISINGLLAGILVLGFVQGAYATEVMRAAIVSIPAGMLTAAHAFAMTPLTMFRRIIIPGFVPRALPGMANLWLIVTKDTALLAVVGISELTLQTKQAAGSTKEYFLFYLVAGGIYLLITLISNVGFKRIERHYLRGYRSHGQGAV